MASCRAREPRLSGRFWPGRWTKSGPRRSTCRKPSPMNSFMDVKTLLFVGLAAMLTIYAGAVFRGGLLAPTPLQTAIGFVTAFFDTLGIGSLANTTAGYKHRNMVPVQLMPGTLNVGHVLSTIAQAFIFMQLVPVEPVTLALMIAAAVAGAWLGGGVVGRWPRRKIQIGMGVALLGAAALMLMTALNVLPIGGATQSLTGIKLGIGLAGNFTLGALMMLGIGLY